MNRHTAIDASAAAGEGLAAASVLSPGGTGDGGIVLGSADLERLTSTQGIAAALAEVADEISRAEDSATLGRALFRNLELWVGLKSITSRSQAAGIGQSANDIGALADYVVRVTLGFAQDCSVTGVTSLVEINLKIVEGLVAAATAALIKDCAEESWRADGAPDGRNAEYRDAAEREIRTTLGTWGVAGH
jgi:hypothetical protein